MIRKPNVKTEFKKKTRTESYIVPNPAPRTSSSHPKNIHKTFLAYRWKEDMGRVSCG